MSRVYNILCSFRGSLANSMGRKCLLQSTIHSHPHRLVLNLSLSKIELWSYHDSNCKINVAWLLDIKGDSASMWAYGWQWQCKYSHFRLYNHLHPLICIPYGKLIFIYHALRPDEKEVPFSISSAVAAPLDPGDTCTLILILAPNTPLFLVFSHPCLVPEKYHIETEWSTSQPNAPPFSMSSRLHLLPD